MNLFQKLAIGNCGRLQRGKHALVRALEQVNAFVFAKHVQLFDRQFIAQILSQPCAHLVLHGRVNVFPIRHIHIEGKHVRGLLKQFFLSLER
ncbi:hypothetical protein D1872_285640 [compost metagenome]